MLKYSLILSLSLKTSEEETKLFFFFVPAISIRVFHPYHSHFLPPSAFRVVIDWAETQIIFIESTSFIVCPGISGSNGNVCTMELSNTGRVKSIASAAYAVEAIKQSELGQPCIDQD